MLDTNLFNSVVRFVREYNYSGDLFSKSFTEYISKHYHNCFIQSTAITEQKTPKTNNISKVDKPNTSNKPKPPKDCSNQELIDSFNRLNSLFFSLSPKYFGDFIFDLHREFVIRFNKTPFDIDKENNKVAWNRKLLYLEDIENFIDDTPKQVPPVILTQFPEQKSLTHVYVSRIGDNQAIVEIRECLKKYSNNEIIDKYNSIKKLYGVHKQALYIIALNIEFISRFGKSPFLIEKNSLISLRGKILYVKNINNFVFLDEN